MGVACVIDESLTEFPVTNEKEFYEYVKCSEANAQCILFTDFNFNFNTHVAKHIWHSLFCQI